MRPLVSRIFRGSQSGFSLVELLIGVVVGSLVMAGAWRFWRFHAEEGNSLGRQIDLRSQMTLSSKKVQRAITLAGIGLPRIANLEKQDAVGSDTLILFANQAESKASLIHDVDHAQAWVRVDDASAFGTDTWLVLFQGNDGVVRRVVRREGLTLHVDGPFGIDFDRTTTVAYPATRQKYWTDQDSSKLYCQIGGQVRMLTGNVRNFQVSFRDRDGATTEVPQLIRSVTFSFTGIFPAREGAINSIILSSTAIPRNVL